MQLRGQGEGRSRERYLHVLSITGHLKVVVLRAGIGSPRDRIARHRSCCSPALAPQLRVSSALPSAVSASSQRCHSQPRKKPAKEIHTSRDPASQATIAERTKGDDQQQRHTKRSSAGASHFTFGVEERGAYKLLAAGQGSSAGVCEKGREGGIDFQLRPFSRSRDTFFSY
eukprot:270353-Rhodomonas_salina.2